MSVSNSINTIIELRTALRTLSGVGATLYKAKAEAPRVKANIAKFAWRLTVEERAEMHSLVVSQVAREFNLVAHTSSKQGGWDFYPQTFSETSKAGKQANDSVRYATQALRPTTREAAEKFVAQMLAPKVTKIASSKDDIAAAVKAQLALDAKTGAWSASKQLGFAEALRAARKAAKAV